MIKLYRTIQFIRTTKYDFYHKSSIMKKTPTKSQFAAFESAYEYFNQRLFHYELPRVILNLSRKSKSMGFVAPFRWKSADAPPTAEDELETDRHSRIHELSINPEILCLSLVEVYSTLVHEQCHIWQLHSGQPSRNGYHNKEWANKMLEVGLTPSSTGMPGGKLTGQSMSDYPTPDGIFLKALDEMPDHFKMPFISIEGEMKYGQLSTGGIAALIGEEPAPPKKNKVKYSCPQCEVNIWGKPELNVICGCCGLKFNEK